MFKPDFPRRPLPELIGYPFGFTPPLTEVELAALPTEPMSNWERMKFALPWFDKHPSEFRDWKVVVEVQGFGDFALKQPCYVWLKDSRNAGKITLGWKLDARLNCTVHGIRIYSPTGEFIGRSENGPYRLWPISVNVGDTLNLSYTVGG